MEKVELNALLATVFQKQSWEQSWVAAWTRVISEKANKCSPPNHQRWSCRVPLGVCGISAHSSEGCFELGLAVCFVCAAWAMVSHVSILFLRQESHCSQRSSTPHCHYVLPWKRSLHALIRFRCILPEAVSVVGNRHSSATGSRRFLGHLGKHPASCMHQKHKEHRIESQNSHRQTSEHFLTVLGNWERAS